MPRLLSRVCNRLKLHLVKPVVALARRRARAGQIARYLGSTAEPGLIIGAGTHRREGWLASDLEPAGSDVVPIDATRPLPFPDRSLAYVFAEHMIEHIDYRAGQRLAGEMFRILRPGGVVRIATPDLARMARLMSEPLDAEAQAYVDWNNGTFGDHVNNRPSFVLNRVMHWWGHRFLYDRPTLADLLTAAGFTALEMPAVGESRHARLRGLEHHGAVVPEAMNRFETMVIEGTRPS